VLTALKGEWSGTLLFVAQPAEEIVAGARRMLEDGLYRRFPKPDYALALHCDAHLPVGTVAYRAGLSLAASDAVDIVVKGQGGHGAAPHLTVDPVVLAARIILDLQTIVSREVNPIDPVVITVGSIHGGTKHNIIPNEVRLQLTVRTTRTETRDHVLRAIERICRAVAASARAPEPEIRVRLDEYTPTTVKPLVLASLRKRLPLIGFSAAFARAGAAIGIYPDFREVGVQTAEMVRRYLEGQSRPGSEGPRKLKAVVNLKVVRLLGLRAVAPEEGSGSVVELVR
ncbi:MAG: amidohydrolase, partial [Chloroflexi bacterium]|nr:amidohydrolase [Chloroflexota bacterium]